MIVINRSIFNGSLAINQSTFSGTFLLVDQILLTFGFVIINVDCQQCVEVLLSAVHRLTNIRRLSSKSNDFSVFRPPRVLTNFTASEVVESFLFPVLCLHVTTDVTYLEMERANTLSVFI